MQSRRRFLRDGGLALAGLGLASPFFHPTAVGEPRRKRLVVLVQRGGVDGLNMVVPHGEPEYYRRRPTIAVARPGNPGGAIDLDGFFGLHPSLSPLVDLYDRGELAIITAVGAPTATSSHLDAQAFMASAVRTASGTMGSTGVEVMETGSWDHHANEGGADGLLAVRLGDFARSIAALADDLGPRLRDTVIVTVSEFGRSLDENRFGGTEHGYATTTMVIGGGVDGGRIYGRWPGLAPDQLHDGHGVRVTTDIRDVLAEVASPGLGHWKPRLMT